MRTKQPDIDIASPPPDWEAMWRDANLPEQDRGEWRRVMAPLTRSPERAERLARHGWTPAQVEAARHDPFMYWPHQLQRDIGADTPEHLAALIVLADSAAEYHASNASLARQVRTDYFAALNDAGWECSRIGELVGVSRQRIQRVLQDRRRMPLIRVRKNTDSDW